jgi:hypothetical protein
MHPTRDTQDVIKLDLAGGRVMRGVRHLTHLIASKIKVKR